MKVTIEFENKRPEPKEQIDWSEVIKLAKENLDEIENIDDDTKHYIYEAVMTSIYGKDVWKFINERHQ